jgi:NAD(P)-dependent dehydrogenase (short-subunit alcohol dehydrogenase family)
MARGAKVALTSRNRDALTALADANALVVPADVTDRASLSAAFDEVCATLRRHRRGDHQRRHPSTGARLGTRCRGGGKAGAGESARRDQCQRAAGAVLRARGSGRLAITASVAGYGGLPTGLVYGATKAALINFAETLYLDLAPRGVAVHLINPGFVKTPLTDLNEFKMPALIEASEAAREILAGIEAGAFEIHFPKRFTRVLKALNLLPYRAYFPLVHRITGL